MQFNILKGYTFFSVDGDMLFDIKLTYNQIENFALNWENPQKLTLKDQRDLFPIKDLKEIRK